MWNIDILKKKLSAIFFRYFDVTVFIIKHSYCVPKLRIMSLQMRVNVAVKVDTQFLGTCLKWEKHKHNPHDGYKIWLDLSYINYIQECSWHLALGFMLQKRGVREKGTFSSTLFKHTQMYLCFFSVLLYYYFFTSLSFLFYFQKRGFFTLLHGTSLMGIFLCFCDNKNLIF